MEVSGDCGLDTDEEAVVEMCEIRRALLSWFRLESKEAAGDFDFGAVVLLRLLDPKMPKDLLSDEAEVRVDPEFLAVRFLSRCSF